MKTNFTNINTAFDILNGIDRIECDPAFTDKVLNEYSNRSSISKKTNLNIALIIIIVIMNTLSVFYMAKSSENETQIRTKYLEAVSDFYSLTNY